MNSFEPGAKGELLTVLSGNNVTVTFAPLKLLEKSTP
jgi:hypothetical protein